MPTYRNESEFAEWAYSPERDVPLTFQWRCPQATMAALNLPQPKNARYADARNALLTEAVLAANAGRAVSYSRRKQHYVGHQRYYGRSYAFSTVLAAVCDGVATGLLEEERARPGSRDRQSCFRATVRLTHSLKIPAPEYRPAPEVIWLRDCDGHLIDYQDCPLTLGLRHEVEMINRGLGSIAIAFNGADMRNEGGRSIVRETLCLSAPPRLRLVFSRASFDMGGRAYGPWQSLPARHRAVMLINGEATLEPDFVALHPSIAYALRGVQFVGDPLAAPTEHVTGPLSASSIPPRRKPDAPDVFEHGPNV